MAVFQKGHNGGRPVGAKNKFARQVWEDLLKVWSDPAIEGGNMNRGTAALLTMFAEKPVEYVKVNVAVLPKDLIIESKVGEMSDEQLERMIEAVRRLEEEPDEVATDEADEDEDHEDDPAKTAA
jgi:hypothetical protein